MLDSENQKQSLADTFENRLKILQISQENICVGVSFLIKLLAFKFITRDSKCVPVKLVEFFYRTPSVAASEKSI